MQSLPIPVCKSERPQYQVVDCERRSAEASKVDLNGPDWQTAILVALGLLLACVGIENGLVTY